MTDPNCKPVHERIYAVPRSMEQQLQQSKETVCLVEIRILEEYQTRSSFNGTHLINRPLKKLRKLLELKYKYFSTIQTSISIIPFIFILMYQVISWG
jgi:hypothetical protein